MILGGNGGRILTCGGHCIILGPMAIGYGAGTAGKNLGYLGAASGGGGGPTGSPMLPFLRELPTPILLS
jgi:hypothetical protein